MQNIEMPCCIAERPKDVLQSFYQLINGILQSEAADAGRGKWVGIPRGPAAVLEELAACHWETGKERQSDDA